jgi:hypothetical protein
MPGGDDVVLVAGYGHNMMSYLAVALALNGENIAQAADVLGVGEERVRSQRQ